MNFLRNYEVPIAVLKAMKVDKIVLLTSNPHKAFSLQQQQHQVIIHSIRPLDGTANPHNQAYLDAKKKKYGSVHDLAITQRTAPEVTTVPKDTTGNSTNPSATTNSSDNSAPSQGSGTNTGNNNNSGGSNENSSYQHQKEMPLSLPSGFNVKNVRIGVVRTMWNDSLVTPLYQGFREGLIQAGMDVNEHTLIEKVCAALCKGVGLLF